MNKNLKGIKLARPKTGQTYLFNQVSKSLSKPKSEACKVRNAK